MTFYAESSCGDIGRRGCLVVGSATELALFDEEAASRVAFAFETDEQHLVDLIRLGQTDGSVPNHVNAENTARTMHCLMKGMRLIGKTGRTREQMTTVLETAMTLLN